jgi:hypothetical protein
VIRRPSTERPTSTVREETGRGGLAPAG